MTVVSRSIASTPARTAIETWDRIVGLISKPESDARKELEKVCGMAASVIAEEIPKDFPIVVAESGPRLRIYCVYGEDAILGENCDEDDLSWNPTDGRWQMYIPCSYDDHKWMSEKLASLSSRISV